MELDVMTNILWLSLVSLMAIKRVLQCIKTNKQKRAKSERTSEANSGNDS